MNLNQRNSTRMQLPEGQEQAVLLVGETSVGVRILDESASGFAVALQADVDVRENQLHVLQSANGQYETRVARIEQYADGRLLGLVRLKDLSAAQDLNAQKTSLRDILFTPQQSSAAGGGMAARTAVAVVVGVLVCGLALYCTRNSPARRNSSASPLPREFTQAVDAEVQKARAEASKAEKVVSELAKKPEKAVRQGARQSAEFLRQQARLSAEVLYGLKLDTDQSRRIRTILNRSSGNPASKEEEIRTVLTPEQARQWESLAP
jgi:hypothetical protein